MSVVPFSLDTLSTYLFCLMVIPTLVILLNQLLSMEELHDALEILFYSFKSYGYLPDMLESKIYNVFSNTDKVLILI